MNAAASRSTDARPQPFPWGAALHFGLGLLRLSPSEFWRLSLKEFLALGGGMKPLESIGRNELDVLMRRWPDRLSAETPR